MEVWNNQCRCLIQFEKERKSTMKRSFSAIALASLLALCAHTISDHSVTPRADNQIGGVVGYVFSGGSFDGTVEGAEIGGAVGGILGLIAGGIAGAAAGGVGAIPGAAGGAVLGGVAGGL